MGEKLWQLGEVVDVDGATARIRLAPAASCERCLAGRGCGAGVFSSLFARKAVELTAANSIGAAPGQNVLIGVTARALAVAAVRLYGFPLLGFMIGLLAAAWLLPAPVSEHALADALALAAGLAAGALSFMFLARRPLSGIEPEMREPACGPS